jgi:hypothetical protein
LRGGLGRGLEPWCEASITPPYSRGGNQKLDA